MAADRGMAENTVASDEFPAELTTLLEGLYSKSSASEFGLSLAEFSSILADISARYVSHDVSCKPSALGEFYSTLRIDDLVLARCCAAANDRAWEVFMARFREKLYDIAAYISKESSRELADSIYADLYGTVLRDGQRVSKLSSYSGRGSLEGWLRTIIAQEYVNQYRKKKRLVSFEEEVEGGASFAAATAPTEAETVIDPRLEAATDEALAGLSAEERFILASYYLDDKTLADIARLLSVHESTVSRKVDKLLKSMRKNILAGLGRRGMSRRQSQEAIEVDIRDVRVNIRKLLTQESQEQAFSEGKAEVPGGQ